MSDGLLLDLDDQQETVKSNENPALALLEEDIVKVDSTPEPSPGELSPASTPATPTSTPASSPREASEASDVPALIADIPTPPGESPASSPASSPRETSTSESIQCPPGNETGLTNGTDLSPSVKDDTKEEEKTVIPLDPRLEEIKKIFGGKWKMVRSDPYDEYLKSLGVGFFSRKFAGRAYHELELTVKEDQTIRIAMRSFFHSQNYIFKLDEEVENLVEKFKQGVVCSYENGKLIQNMTPIDPAGNKTLQHVERQINENGEQEVVFTAGDVTCRRYYCRLEDLNKKPATEDKKTKDSTETEKEDEQKPEESEKSTEAAVEESEDKDQSTEKNAEQVTEQNDESNTDSQTPEEVDESTPRTTSTSEA